MWNFTFNSNGKLFTVNAPDADRARCLAKKKAGADWTPKARMIKIDNGVR